MSTLINCRVCGKQVSSNAKLCPHCGERSPEPYLTTLKYSLIGLLIVGVVIIIGILLFLVAW
jgi:predicted amidophosphoribosyltransferase